MEFTYSSYCAFIELLRKNNYKIANYGDVCEDKSVIIRHDVDFDIEKAAEFAKLEKAIGVRSTYFVLVAGDFYNLFCKQGRKALETIKNCGHSIGLHFDETNYSIGDNPAVLVDAAQNEKRILEMAARCEVHSISMHRPSQFSLNGDFQFNDMFNSYSGVFFQQWKYISDSRMSWKEDPVQVVACGKYRQLHILFHPFWYSNVESSVRDKLILFINAAKERQYSAISSNFRNVEEFITKEDVL